MTSEKLTISIKWTVIVILTLLHPLLLIILFPVVGEPSNLVIFIGPVTASMLFNWKLGAGLIVLNGYVTSRVFAAISAVSHTEGLPRAALVMIIVLVLCIGADLLSRHLAERWQLSKELERAQKMEAIGKLAGGVAHDMNNILNAIMGSVFALRHELQKDNPDLKDIDNIAAACDRGAQLTRNLLGFSRKNTFETHIFALNSVVETVESILVRTIKKQIDIVVKRDPAEPMVEGNQSQLENAIMNLCINGIDAIEDKGTLTITTGHTYDMAHIRVSDTGSGMERNVKKRAFEPFFTTKEEGKGTGLGLSLVHGIVHSMNGRIGLETQTGTGTTITLHIPRSDKAADMPISPKHAPITPPKEAIKGKTVLLVDDEQLVLRTGMRMLKAHELRVLCANGGEEALEIFEANKNDIDLIVLDIIMPRMDGIAVLEELQKRQVAQPVLLVSGYSKDIAKLQTIPGYATNIDYLSKPYSSKQFLHKAIPLLQNAEANQE